MSTRTPRVGDWVEVRGKDEILRTLDERGCLDGMPFMPEMFDFCGKRFRVFKSAHKTCDTVFPVRSRRLNRTVHLQTRCSGLAHGGCEASCLLFWKTAWLKPVEADQQDRATPMPQGAGSPRLQTGTDRSRGCSEADVWRATRAEDSSPEPTFACQATQLPYASDDLSPFDIRQYIQDYRSGNVGLGQWLRGILYISYNNLINLGIGIGAPLRWLYDRLQSIWGGVPYPRRFGTIALGNPTPAGQLDLREGEWVRVKSYPEILATCNVENRNRGMGFDGEMVPYCGGTYRVRKLISKIVDERTGKLMQMKNPCIVLDDVVCQGRYSECRLFCPRAIYPYWREVWLERSASPPRAADPKTH